MQGGSLATSTSVDVDLVEAPMTPDGDQQNFTRPDGSFSLVPQIKNQEVKFALFLSCFPVAAEEFFAKHRMLLKRRFKTSNETTPLHDARNQYVMNGEGILIDHFIQQHFDVEFSHMVVPNPQGTQCIKKQLLLQEAHFAVCYPYVLADVPTRVTIFTTFVVLNRVLNYVQNSLSPLLQAEFFWSLCKPRS